jgi:hypothetical protein
MGGKEVEERGGERKLGILVSTCLNIQWANKKHQAQIHWLLKELKCDFYSA